MLQQNPRRLIGSGFLGVIHALRARHLKIGLTLGAADEQIGQCEARVTTRIAVQM